MPSDLLPRVDTGFANGIRANHRKPPLLLSRQALEIVAIPLKTEGFALAGPRSIRRQNPRSRRLARPCKRHYTFARRIGIDHRDPGSARRQCCLKALMCRVFKDQSERQCRDRAGCGEADDFAPFVYRLGRHPFTVERAVRFR
jgi:hypothetical protein